MASSPKNGTIGSHDTVARDNEADMKLVLFMLVSAWFSSLSIAWKGYEAYRVYESWAGLSGDNKLFLVSGMVFPIVSLVFTIWAGYAIYQYKQKQRQAKLR